MLCKFSGFMRAQWLAPAPSIADSLPQLSPMPLPDSTAAFRCRPERRRSRLQPPLMTQIRLRLAALPTAKHLLKLHIL
jgi:hypothetical protein